MAKLVSASETARGFNIDAAFQAKMAENPRQFSFFECAVKRKKGRSCAP